VLDSAQRLHFVGIGGVGMSALARILAWQGKQVSGTDRQPSFRLEQMRREGLLVQVGHDAAAVGEAEAVVVTTALGEDNVELAEARRRGLPVLHRAEVLAAIVHQRRSVAVTGSHGKSTTTAMVGRVLEAAGLDPLVIVGGDVEAWGGNVRFGEGGVIVFEACESDGTMLLYEGASQIITSLDPDHLDQHKTFDALVETVRQFANSADPEGFVVYHCEDESVSACVSQTPAALVSYGQADGDWRVGALELHGEEGLEFTLHGPQSQALRVKLPMYGLHNALNATAAMAAAAELGVEPQRAAGALADFKGVQRRFEQLGMVGRSLVIDDYAHHPREVRATLRAAREHLGRQVVVVFQPHLYSRTEYLMDDFAQSFGDADAVIITDIYPAREDPIPGITAEVLASRVAEQRGTRPTAYLSGFDRIADHLRRNYSDGWAILIMGAGDVRKIGEELVRGAPAHA